MAKESLPNEVLEAAVESDGVIAFDCETTGLDAFTVRPTLYSIAAGSGAGMKSAVLKPGPLAHRFLKAIFMNPRLRVVMHNSSFDLKIAHRFIVPYREIRAQIADTMVYAWLHDNRGAPRFGKPFSLKSLTRRYFGYKMNTLNNIFKEGPLAQERLELEKKAKKLKKNWKTLVKRHNRRQLTVKRQIRDHILARLKKQKDDEGRNRYTDEERDIKERAEEAVRQHTPDFERGKLAVKRLLRIYKKKHAEISRKLQRLFVRYALEDAEWTLKLYRKTKKYLIEMRLTEWTRVEMSNRMLATDMEINGVAIDAKVISNLEDAFVPEITEIEEKMYRLAAREAKRNHGIEAGDRLVFNPASPDEVSHIIHLVCQALPDSRRVELKEHINSKRRRKKDPSAKPFFSTKKTVLKYTNHQMAEYVLRWRKLIKLRSTYTEKLKAIGGRIHAYFRSSGTDTGRYSSSGPNLQNIPSRDAIGKKIREGFTARDDDHVLIVADLSQIELRVAAMVAQEPALLEVYSQYKTGPDGERDYSIGDVHEATRSGLDKACPFEVKRPLAKIANFALLYGMVATSFAIAFELEFDVAEAARTGFFETYPRLGEITDELHDLWRSGVRKWRIPFSGRRRIWNKWYWEDGLKKKLSVSKGNLFNTLVQGSAADILKAGLAMFWERVVKTEEYTDKVFPLMQVHDEVVVEVHKSVALEVACLLKVCMEYQHFETEVPILADAFIVDRWSEGKEGMRPKFKGKPYHSEEVKAQKFDDDGNPILDEDRQPVFKVEEEQLYPELNDVLEYLHKDHRQWCREFLFPDGDEPEPIIPYTDFVAEGAVA